MAVLPEGRANPNQLCAPACGREGFAALLDAVRSCHREAHGRDDDLVVALQLTHSGRFSKPSAAGRQPRIAYRHPLLDARHGVARHEEACVMSDADVKCTGVHSLRQSPVRFAGKPTKPRAEATGPACRH